VGRDEGRRIHVGDVTGIVGAIQDMVRQQVGDIAGVVFDHASNGGILEELLEGIVAWGQDGDISKTTKVSKKTWLSGDESCECQHTKYTIAGLVRYIPPSDERVEFSDSIAAVRLGRLWAVARPERARVVIVCSFMLEVFA
jgi:hypothetical protein